jgi:hypothetical protein
MARSNCGLPCGDLNWLFVVAGAINDDADGIWKEKAWPPLPLPVGDMDDDAGNTLLANRLVRDGWRVNNGNTSVDKDDGEAFWLSFRDGDGDPNGDDIPLFVRTWDEVVDESNGTILGKPWSLPRLWSSVDGWRDMTPFDDDDGNRSNMGDTPLPWWAPCSNPPINCSRDDDDDVVVGIKDDTDDAVAVKDDAK